MSDESPRRILLVEDEAIIAMSEQMVLERNGYAVTVGHSGEEAIGAFRREPGVDLVLMDIDGTVAAQTILSDAEVPVVFLSSHTEPDVVDQTEKITSYGYIVKSSGDTVLLASIRMAFRLFEARVNERLALKRLNRILADNRSFLRTMLDTTFDGFCVVDSHGRILEANRTYSEMTGYREGELTAMSIWEVNA